MGVVATADYESVLLRNEPSIFLFPVRFSAFVEPRRLRVAMVTAAKSRHPALDSACTPESSLG